MAFTYDATTTRGRVRLLVRDTQEAQAVFTDEEIDAFIALVGDDALLAAALACRDLAARGVKQFPGVSVGGFRLDGTVADGWNKLANYYEELSYKRAGSRTIVMDWDEFATTQHEEWYAATGNEQPTD